MIDAAQHPEPRDQIAGLLFATLLLDPGLRVSEANPAAESMLGQSSSRLCGKPVFDVVQLNEGLIAALTRDDGPVVARDLPVRFAKGEHRANVTVSPLSSHPGWRVMTLSESGAGDLGGDDEQPAFLRAPAILAHEIKNPLSAIRGAAQLLARKLGHTDGALATLITREVDRIASLVERMQFLGARTAGPAAAFNLHEAVRNAISTVLAGGLGEVMLSEEFDPSLPPVLGSRAALEQVLINLIANARDACADRPSGSIWLRTRFASGPIPSAIRPGRSVRLPIEVTVSDNGPGIDPALGDHVFEPFVTSKPAGQGLGLTLVRKLVRDMGGRISHERDERAGLTHFRVHLPLAPAEPAA